MESQNKQVQVGNSSRSLSKELLGYWTSFKQYMLPVTEQYNNVKANICNTEKQISIIYGQVPFEMTDFKRSFLLPIGNENTRLIVLGFSALTSVLLLRRVAPGPLILTRNAVFCYYGLGLFIAPEIYNPLISLFNCDHSKHNCHDQKCYYQGRGGYRFQNRLNEKDQQLGLQVVQTNSLPSHTMASPSNFLSHAHDHHHHQIHQRDQSFDNTNIRQFVPIERRQQ